MENKSFFGAVFRNYFSCSGRLNRKPYICRGIAVTFVSTALAFLLFFILMFFIIIYILITFFFLINI